MKKIIFLAFFCISLIISTSAYSEEDFLELTVQYELKPEMIEQINITQIKEGIYEVDLLLKEEYKKEFREFTANNIGRRAELICSGQVLMAPIIRAEIDSGRMGFGKMDSEKTINLINELTVKSSRLNN